MKIKVFIKSRLNFVKLTLKFNQDKTINLGFSNQNQNFVHTKLNFLKIQIKARNGNKKKITKKSHWLQASANKLLAD